MANFYPNYFNQNQQQNYQNQFQNNSIIWVSGEAGAKAYIVAPNTTVALWDSESQAIYLKSADASGMPNIKVLDYTIRDNTNPTTSPNIAPTSDFATKDDILSIEDRLSRLEGKLERRNNKHKKGGLNNEQSNADA